MEVYRSGSYETSMVGFYTNKQMHVLRVDLADCRSEPNLRLRDGDMFGVYQPIKTQF